MATQPREPRRPASARPTVQRPTIISGPPPNPAVSLLYDAVASGCANAGARRQADAAAKLHFDPDLPAFIPPPPPSRKQLRQQAPSKDAPQPQLMPPSPSIGQRASKLLNGPPARLTSTSDPELLQKLLHLVRQGLRDADEPGTPGYIEQRLEVFRRAFGHYISALWHYSPLLGVQEAYEDALAHAVARATGCDEVSERLSLIQAEARQLLEHQREDAAAEREAMLGMCAERDEKIRECQKEMDRLKMEVKKLSNDLGHMKNQKNEWEMRCADVAKQVEHWQAECVEARRKADEDDELERMRKENKQLFDRERMLLEEDREQRQLFRETKHELEGLKASTVSRELYKQSQDQLSRQMASSKAARAEVDELSRLIGGGESHALYPNGLQWGDSELDVMYLDPGWRGKQVHDIIGDLVVDVLTLHHQKKMTEQPKAGGGAAAAPSAGSSSQPSPMFQLDTTDLAAVGCEGAPKLTAGVVASADTTAASGIVLLQGDPNKARAAFDGFVRLRPSLWGVEEMQLAVRRLWTAYKKHPKVLSLQGGANRALPAHKRFMKPELIVEIFSDLTARYLAERHESKPTGEPAAVTAATAIMEGGRRSSLTSRRDDGPPPHPGLLCADTYNLHASMWGLRKGSDPRIAMFVQVCLGRLCPGIFAELHKICNELYRALNAVSKNERVPTDQLRMKLANILTGASETEREGLVTALLEEAASLGEKGQGGIRTKMLEPSHKEPCEGVPPGSSLARLQRLLLVHALRLRDDVEAAIRRCAAGSTHLKPQDLKTALWRVDSEIPEPRVDEYITLVYGEDYYDPPHKLGEFQTMAVEEVCARLFAEPFVKRWSPRTHEGMREGIIANLKAVDKGKKGKGGGGKKKKGGEVEVPMVGMSKLLEAIQKADTLAGMRAPGETDFVAKNVIEAAWSIAAARRSQAGGVLAGAAPGEPIYTTVAAGEEAEAPLEDVIEGLGDVLLVPTRPSTSA